jgi:protein-S-isoprenylcysteine O-methyltransferase Ste14
MTTNKILVFIAFSILLVAFSWFVSLREKRYHGIPRFFVFEGLLLLGLLQADAWFIDPLAVRQLISWFLFGASIGYAFFGIFIYLKKGRPGENFENTTRLVTSGLYKYIRHPMYGSLLFLAWGMFLKDISTWSIIAVFLISIAVYLTCKIEEKEMLAKFGAEYQQYMSGTKLFIPYLY